ncbi:hypothetical protein JX580_07375 [Thiomicrospira microaerophila]|uniref:hypothetical protein n=1 Tax=Thiomicrospira microaerophila TaxID=406020 RepID=UPI00200CC8E9|nr:hypothetical protein [Thiomicrospira microaerophila]UQB41505.1 hypothetical protein JX580_07375 [Thiomicrospira microaerophila]
MLKLFNIIFFTLLVNFQSVYADQRGQPLNCQYTTNPYSLYQHTYEVDEFIIFYNLTGSNAIVNQEDINNNAIPDIVEDIMLQLVTMRQALDYLGFEHPFKRPRFQTVNVDKIHVRITDIKNNGLAFDEAHRVKNTDECVLLISLSNRLVSGNVTPAHELFHLYQYGYTMFKQRWFTEGTARWSQDILEKNTEYPITPLPQTQEEKQTFFSKSYDAYGVWNNFIHQIDPKGDVSFPESLMEKRYLSGEPVVNDSRLHGVEFVIKTFEKLDKLDNQISENEGLFAFFWDEAYQRSPIHNKIMWEKIINIFYVQNIID